MTPANRALLCSLLLFPGSGYFVLKHHWRGLAAALITLVCVGGIGYEAWVKAHLLAEKIVAGELAYDVAAISAQLAALPDVFSHAVKRALTVALIGTWLVGIVDAYRLGRRGNAGAPWLD